MSGNNIPNFEFDQSPTFSNSQQVILYVCDIPKEEFDDHVQSKKTIKGKYYRTITYGDDDALDKALFECFHPSIIAIFSDLTVGVTHQIQAKPNNHIH